MWQCSQLVYNYLYIFKKRERSELPSLSLVYYCCLFRLFHRIYRVNSNRKSVSENAPTVLDINRDIDVVLLEDRAQNILILEGVTSLFKGCL